MILLSPDLSGFFADLHAKIAGLHWFVIADSAQDPILPGVFNAPHRSLFNAVPGSALAEKSPYLVELSPPNSGNAGWDWIARNGGMKPSITILASSLDFEKVFSCLEACTEISLPDGDTMFFAYWDPAILGTLFGQEDDLTLHVPGPVLSIEQQRYFANVLHGWWYWDRKGELHEIELVPPEGETARAPFQLNQAQVDLLVEASVPDHLVYFIELNQAHLFQKMSASERYEFVRTALYSARLLGLHEMRDLVNFVCVMLIYKEQAVEESAVADILDKVRRKEISFDEAMQLFP